MALFKKTFIFSGQPPKGFLTALKIGATCGVKLTLNNLASGMILAVKIANNPIEVFDIRSLKEEFRVSDFDEKTHISAVVFENNAVFTHTGNTPTIVFEEWVVKEEIPKQVSSDTQTKKSTQSNSDIDARNTNSKKGDKVYYEPLLKEERNTTESVRAEVVDEPEEAFRFFKKQSDSHFYDRVRSRMEEMLVIHPKEERLEKLIPDSKWVRVPYSDDEFYVVGILKDLDRVTHIGYGVKGLRSVFPPKEAEALSEFLPTAGDEGYWLMFQDSETGEMLPID